MAFDRPTFSESWYRVGELKPRLRTLVQSYRQHYRGDTWMVLRDPGNNKFYRLDDANYRFVGLLDGKRTIDQVWREVQDELGDRAPTQGEVIQLLGQLYTSNLLEAEVPADAAGMFERYRKRKKREVSGYLLNLLFARIPLIDPEPILEKWIKVFGWIFSPFGVAMWLLLVGYAVVSVAPRSDELFGASIFDQQQGILSPGNLPYLYVMLVLTKLVHEFGHGFCCKYFGKKTHSGGEVHTLGIMLMAFIPMPYVDATSSWAFRNKWHRAFVGAAGMYVEVGMAAIAALIWVNTGDREGVAKIAHALAYNTIFIAGVSTLLFNANPLIRFDGYYILSDLAEMPNLAQRSKEYLYFLVKKYIYKVERPRDSSHTVGERPWLFIYSIASAIYRVFITVSILMFVMTFEVFFLIGVIGAIMGIASFAVVPFCKWWHYVLTNPEPQRTRIRTVWSTAAICVVTIGGVCFLPVPEHGRASGVVEPTNVRVVYAQTPGFVRTVITSGQSVQDGDELFVSVNPELELELDRLAAQGAEMRAMFDQAVLQDAEQADVVRERLDVLAETEARVRDDLGKLTQISSFAGRWVTGAGEGRSGQFVNVGDPVGVVVTDEDVFIRISVGQSFGPRLDGREGKRVTLRVMGRPGQYLEGTIKSVAKAGTKKLQSEALGYAAGGDIETSMGEDGKSQQAKQALYTIEIALDNPADAQLLSGQRLVARFYLDNTPVVIQAWRALYRAFREQKQA